MSRSNFPSPRLVILAGVTLFHMGAFWFLGTFNLFPSRTKEDEDTPMLRVTLPKAEPPPPPPLPAQGGGGSMGFSMPPMATLPAVITTPIVNATFSLPKVPLPNLDLSKLPSGNGQGRGAGQGNGVGAGTHIGTGEGIIGKDGRFISGLAMHHRSLTPHATEIDEIRNDPATSAIHWDNFQPQWRSSTAGWAAELSAPQRGGLGIEDMLFGDYLDTYSNPDGNPDKARMEKVACFVILSNFTAPWGNYPRIFDKVIRIMRERRTRLCIIAFDNEPYPPLVAYVQESGGVIIRPGKGIPNSELAKQLGAALPVLDP